MKKNNINLIGYAIAVTIGFLFMVIMVSYFPEQTTIYQKGFEAGEEHANTMCIGNQHLYYTEEFYEKVKEFIELDNLRLYGNGTWTASWRQDG